DRLTVARHLGLRTTYWSETALTRTGAIHRAWYPKRVRTGSDQPGLVAEHDELGAVTGSQLGQQTATYVHVHPRADLAIGFAPADPGQDLAFPWSQRVQQLRAHVDVQPGDEM